MIVKHKINLIIPSEVESRRVKRLKFYLPLIATVSLLIFVILFLLSIIFVNTNITKFNNLNLEVDNLEKKISSFQTTEGIYTFISMMLKNIDQIARSQKNYLPLLDQISELPSSTIKISTISVNDQGNVSFSVVASSSASLDNFITFLMEKDNNHLISNIKADGIVRQKGKYLFNISFLADKSIFQ
ncbi:hypothetical protein A2960_02180 [Candidatus Gottesmanbacteria bacterium RIFCSPLOWO2_01_FULL_39_12b]|uniref:PilN domain-containing protein n=1 Tax=Candidatus Gottesmanbacteria bacterium RIFCSPLOWO2_01_FULL_39_12b TaxID=1798388 RepID=A0A1F6AQG3_9BACT|nr:MAG: hypothetical protein A2960_02180 [Candidatus Gottesmanbacteria bacterium RIFCSPLOWO2_01_FULL_39_12b]